MDASVILEDRQKSNKPNYMGKLIKLDKLDRDMYCDFDCQVVGYYCSETCDRVVLKVWDGSKCPYITKKDVAGVNLDTKFEDPYVADIEDYCIYVNIFGKYMLYAEMIEIFDIIMLQNVHAINGFVNIPVWSRQKHGISIYDNTAVFTLNFENNLNLLRHRLTKGRVNLTNKPHCSASNLQPGEINAPSTTICSSDAFAPFEIMRLLIEQPTAAISGNKVECNNAGTESVKLLPDLVENVPAASFGFPTHKPQNKQLQPCLSKIGQEDMFFDIVCQVVGCYQNAEPLKVILKVWDGTKCQYAKWVTHYDSWTTVFEDPHIDEIDEYCVHVNVYDEYMEKTREIKLGDIVKLCNVRSRSGVFAMNGGRIKQRKILICLATSEIAKSLSSTLKALRENHSKSKTADVNIETSSSSSSNIITPVPLQRHTIDESNNQNSSLDIRVDKVIRGISDKTEVLTEEVPIQSHGEVQVLNVTPSLTKAAPAATFFPEVVCAIPVKECQGRPSSVAGIMRTPVPRKFCFHGAVFDIHPRANKISELVKWFCESCQNTFSSKDLEKLTALGHYRYQCPCNSRESETIPNSKTDTVQILEPIFLLHLTICDKKYNKLKAMVFGSQAETFFRNYSPLDFLERQNVRERFAALFRSLCKAPGCLTRSSLALHCQICSSAAKNGKAIYSIANTQLIPFDGIIKIG